MYLDQLLKDHLIEYILFNIEQIIEFSSEIMTLEKGDLILTGTPEGVGETFEGDVLEARLNNKQYLKVNVKKEQFANRIIKQ